MTYTVIFQEAEDLECMHEVVSADNVQDAIAAAKLLICPPDPDEPEDDLFDEYLEVIYVFPTEPAYVADQSDKKEVD